MFGRLCHGRERRPLEPYGVVSPFLRTAGWALVCVASLTSLAAFGVGMATRDLDVVAVMARVSGGLLAFGMTSLVAATMTRPAPIAYAAWDSERES